MADFGMFLISSRENILYRQCMLYFYYCNFMIYSTGILRTEFARHFAHVFSNKRRILL